MFQFRKWWREIQTVGLKDWWWFVVYLKRNEFSRKLSLSDDLCHQDGWRKLQRERQRAHEIDMKLEDISHGLPQVRVHRRKDL